MLFTSYEFLAFLAGVLLLYYVLPKKLQWPLLLVASYAFYAIAGLKYLPSGEVPEGQRGAVSG